MAPQASKRFGDPYERCMPLEAVDIGVETQSRYTNALNIGLDTIGRTRTVDSLLPADLQQPCADPIATRPEHKILIE